MLTGRRCLSQPSLKSIFDESRDAESRDGRFLTRLQQAFDIFCEDVALDVYGIAHFQGRQIRVLVREWNNGGFDDAVVPARNGQAYAVERDRALHRDVTRKFAGHLDAEPPVCAFRFEARDAADSVHVALHEMAAEFFHRSQWPLEIDARAGLHFAEAGAAQRLAGKIGGESFVRDIDRRQAAAVYGDTA